MARSRQTTRSKPKLRSRRKLSTGRKLAIVATGAGLLGAGLVGGYLLKDPTTETNDKPKAGPSPVSKIRVPKPDDDPIVVTPGSNISSNTPFGVIVNRAENAAAQHPEVVKDVVDLVRRDPEILDKSLWSVYQAAQHPHDVRSTTNMLHVAEQMAQQMARHMAALKFQVPLMQMQMSQGAFSQLVGLIAFVLISLTCVYWDIIRPPFKAAVDVPTHSMGLIADVLKRLRRMTA